MFEFENNWGQLFPDDIFCRIFAYLDPKTLVRCRSVCSVWTNLVDQLNTNQIIWCRNCRRDYPDIYDTAYFKTNQPTRTWYKLYRSLTLWNKLQDAEESTLVFSTARNPNEIILDFQILKNKTIGILKVQGIFYYDYALLQQHLRKLKYSNCNSYSENLQIVAFQHPDFGLHAIHKEWWDWTIGVCVRVAQVKSFILIEENIFYVKEGCSGDDIYSSKASNGVFVSHLLVTIPDGVMSLGCQKENLYILTNTLNIYILVGIELRTMYAFEVGKKCRELILYNFLDKLDWRLYYCKVMDLHHTEPVTDMTNITKIRTYGNIVFVGTAMGVLRIYKSHYIEDIFDIFGSVPLKEYDLKTPSDLYNLKMCEIIQIDVVEEVDSHKVLIGMPKKIISISFRHMIPGRIELLGAPLDGNRW